MMMKLRAFFALNIHQRSTLILLILCQILTNTHPLPISNPNHLSPSDLDLLIDPVFQSERDSNLESKRVVAKSVYNTVIRVTTTPCGAGTQRAKEGGPCVPKYSSPGPILDDEYQRAVLDQLASLGTRTRRPAQHGNRNRNRNRTPTTTTTTSTTTDSPPTTFIPTAAPTPLIRDQEGERVVVVELTSTSSTPTREEVNPVVAVIVAADDDVPTTTLKALGVDQASTSTMILQTHTSDTDTQVPSGTGSMGSSSVTQQISENDMTTTEAPKDFIGEGTTFMPVSSDEDSATEIDVYMKDIKVSEADLNDMTTTTSSSSTSIVSTTLKTMEKSVEDESIVFDTNTNPTTFDELTIKQVMENEATMIPMTITNSSASSDNVDTFIGTGTTSTAQNVMVNVNSSSDRVIIPDTLVDVKNNNKRQINTHPTANTTTTPTVGSILAENVPIEANKITPTISSESSHLHGFGLNSDNFREEYPGLKSETNYPISFDGSITTIQGHQVYQNEIDLRNIVDETDDKRGGDNLEREITSTITTLLLRNNTNQSPRIELAKGNLNNTADVASASNDKKSITAGTSTTSSSWSLAVDVTAPVNALPSSSAIPLLQVGFNYTDNPMTETNTRLSDETNFETTNSGDTSKKNLIISNILPKDFLNPFTSSQPQEPVMRSTMATTPSTLMQINDFEIEPKTSSTSSMDLQSHVEKLLSQHGNSLSIPLLLPGSKLDQPVVVVDDDEGNIFDIDGTSSATPSSISDGDDQTDRLLMIEDEGILHHSSTEDEIDRGHHRSRTRNRMRNLESMETLDSSVENQSNRRRLMGAARSIPLDLEDVKGSFDYARLGDNYRRFRIF